MPNTHAWTVAKTVNLQLWRVHTTGLHSFSSKVVAMTGLYFKVTGSPLLFWNESVCFIQFWSSRSVKSSRAWAPRDSFLAAAETAVCVAQVRRFCNSRVSTRSVFQIILRSLIPTLSKFLSACVILRTPSCKDSSVRKTATSLYVRRVGERVHTSAWSSACLDGF